MPHKVTNRNVLTTIGISEDIANRVDNPLAKLLCCCSSFFRIKS